MRRSDQRSAVKNRGLKIGGVIVAFVAAAIAFALLTQDDDDNNVAATDTTTTQPAESPESTDTTVAPGETPPSTVAAVVPGETDCPPATGDVERTIDFSAPFKNCLTDGVDYQAKFTTTAGVVVVDLREDEMPNTVNNFVALSRYKYYDETKLFRTDPSIDIIQGGSPHTQDNTDSGPGYNIPDTGGAFIEDPATGQTIGPFTYLEGQLIMARSAGPDSSSAQFFFSTGPDVSLLDSQGTYLLFGDVTEGLDVLQAIMATHKEDPNSGLGGAPDPEVIITSVEIIEA